MRSVGLVLRGEAGEDISLNMLDHTTAVLIGYYQGEQFIVEQLKSIFDQGTKVKIWISSDSDQGDLNCLINENFSIDESKLIKIIPGPREGFAQNFLSLTSHEDIQAEYFAFADQDDVWEQNKLAEAIQWLKSVPEDCPAYYCSRTRLIDESGQEIGLSPLFERPPCFQNSLVQSIAGGNTMVFNGAARDLLIKTKGTPVVSHDWWAYQMVTGAGGIVRYDENPTTKYRQHGSNIVGSNTSFSARLERLRMLLKGTFKQWNDTQCTALRNHKRLLSVENQKIFDLFDQARNKWLVPRLYNLFKSGIFRQTLMGNLGLIVAAVLKKV